MHFRVIGGGGPVSLLIEVEPADAGELPWVRAQPRSVVQAQHEPQVNVEMTVRAVGRRDRQEERPVVVELCLYPEFFTRLADDGLARVLAVLDVPAGRQPQPGLAVVAEQQASAGRVDRDKVDDEMLGRCVRRDRPEELTPGCDPVNDVRLVGGFPLIEWLYAADKILNP